jgi:hypothetical protein
MGLVFGAAMGLAVSTASAQPTLPLKSLPQGFKVVSQVPEGPMISFQAVMPNEIEPKLAVDPDIHIDFGWQAMPSAAQIVDAMEQQKEEPSAMGMTKTEPQGKERFKGGVLRWEKTTTPWVGLGKGSDWVTYSATWVGAVNGGLLGISVKNVAGSKDKIQGWIEALIEGSGVKLP